MTVTGRLHSLSEPLGGRKVLIPAFNHSGVLPPFQVDPTLRGGSPYVTDLCTLINVLGKTPERRSILQGLLDFRAALRAIGVTTGFQLLDGSFTEDCETHRGRPPGDIDVVTYGYLPVAPPDIQAFVATNIALFSPAATKATYKCDAYFIDLAKHAQLVVDDSFYFYGLFSHQKVTLTWKGMLRIPLTADDVAAEALLASLRGTPGGP